MVRKRSRHTAVHKCCVLDIAYGFTVAGFADQLWQLEHCATSLLPLRDKGIWEKILEVLIDEPDFE